MIDIVIVTFGKESVVSRCLGSIRDSVPISLRGQVLVADNASKPAIVPALRRQFPEFEFFERASNDGFAVATNDLIRRTSADWVLVLNPDTELRSGTLETLLSSAQDYPRTGIVGCRLIRSDGTLDLAAKRGLPTVTGALSYAFPPTRRFSSYLAPHVASEGVGIVGAVNGAFMLVRREAIEEVGLLDETFWMYGEDLDWCKRFQDAGWTVLYDGRVEAIHLKGASSDGVRGAKLTWHFYRSQALYLMKHLKSFERLSLFALLPGVGLAFVASLALSLARRTISSITSLVSKGASE